MKASGALSGKGSPENLLDGCAWGSSLVMDVRSDDGWSTWMTMAAAIELMEKEKLQMAVRGGDAANDIRRLCITLDALFEGKMGNQTKVGDGGNISWRLSGQNDSRAAISGKLL